MTNDKRATHEYLSEFLNHDDTLLFGFHDRERIIRIMDVLSLEKRGWFLLWTVVGKGEGVGAEIARDEAKRILSEAQ